MEIKYLLMILLFMGLACKEQELPTKLNKSFHGQQVIVKPQMEFEISLPANPSTGFTWTVVDSQNSIVRQVDDVKFNAESAKMGASGEQVFRFIASQPGKTQLKLVYHRPWETEIAPADSFMLTVTVVK
jgi:inhibitor of cysteine peptidase